MSQKNSSETDKSNSLQRLINNGAEIAGGAVGGALGFLAGGPVGAAALGASGAAVGVMLKHIGQEVSERMLGPRETVRVGGVLAIAAEEIRHRLESGESVRNDGFFDEKKMGRSDAEEVAESVLLKSQKEPEEKKIPYMGYLLASVTFDAKISAHMAHQLTKAAEQLTYRQLCLLKLVVAKDKFNLRNENYRSLGQFSKDLYQILYECLELERKGFIVIGSQVVFGATDIMPSKMKVEGLGIDLFVLMKLDLIPNEDLLPIVAQLE